MQSLLASGGELAAFPETNVLYEVADDLDYRRYGAIIGRRRMAEVICKRMINWCGVTLAFDWKLVSRNLPGAVTAAVGSELRGRRWLIRTIVKDFQEVMYEAAGGRRWMDKTPQNIFVIEFLERYIPNALYVHVMRDPVANVASLVDASRRYETFRARFGGAHGFKKAVAYCRRSRRASLARLAAPGHYHVDYEVLAADTGTVLRSVEEFAGLTPFSLKERYDTTGIVTPEEVWKQGGKEIKFRAGKEKRVLDDAEVEYIKKVFGNM